MNESTLKTPFILHYTKSLDDKLIDHDIHLGEKSCMYCRKAFEINDMIYVDEGNVLYHNICKVYSRRN